MEAEGTPALNKYVKQTAGRPFQARESSSYLGLALGLSKSREPGTARPVSSLPGPAFGPYLAQSVAGPIQHYRHRKHTKANNDKFYSSRDKCMAQDQLQEPRHNWNPQDPTRSTSKIRRPSCT
jgi:hypothetical protein